MAIESENTTGRKLIVSHGSANFQMHCCIVKSTVPGAVMGVSQCCCTFGGGYCGRPLLDSQLRLSRQKAGTRSVANLGISAVLSPSGTNSAVSDFYVRRKRAVVEIIVSVAVAGNRVTVCALKRLVRRRRWQKRVQ